MLADRYLDAFRTRRACCRALLELSRRQADLISVRDYAALIDLLGHKQQLIDELAAPHGGLSPWWRGWKTDRERLAPGERAACEAVLDETETLLAELLSLDAAGTATLSTERESTAAALAEVNHAGLALEGYLPPAEVAVSRRLDLGL